MVIQQAMAAGLPVIATSVGGIPDQIENELTGLLFEPGDIKRLSELITRMTDRPETGRCMADAAKTIAVARFRASSVAKETISVYRTMLERDGRHRGNSDLS